jgi:hypothetical protein
MTRPMVYLFDSNTGEEITREMNDAEYAQSLLDKAEVEAEQVKQAEAKALEEAKKATKAEALAALGLSQEVINLLAE